MNLIESHCASSELSEEEWKEILAVTHAAFAEHAQRGINMRPCSITLEQHKLFLQECQVFQIRENNRILAYKAGRLVKNGQLCYFQVQLICVLPSCKGKGLGKKVHALLERWALEHNCLYLLTDTSCQAKSSLAFHHAMGFQNWYFCHFTSRNYNSIVLRKDIQSRRLPTLKRWYTLGRSWLSVHLKYRSDGTPTQLYHFYQYLHKTNHRHPKNAQKLSHREIQETTFNLLVYFDKLCQQHGLRYILCYGSLLGAVRHKGFIPWDDDIDVSMPLPDYEKLLQHFDRINDSPQIELLHGMKRSVGIPFAMMVDKNTITYTPGRDKKHSHPIAIDIFPAFALSDNTTEAENQIRSLRALILQTHSYLKCPAWIRLKERILFALNSSRKLHKLLKQINDIIHTKSWGSTRHIRVMSLEEDQMLLLPNDVFETYQLHNFEGGRFRIPACAHEHLSELYGNYMQLPPVEARKSILSDAYRLTSTS